MPRTWTRLPLPVLSALLSAMVLGACSSPGSGQAPADRQPRTPATGPTPDAVQGPGAPESGVDPVTELERRCLPFLAAAGQALGVRLERGDVGPSLCQSVPDPTSPVISLALTLSEGEPTTCEAFGRGEPGPLGAATQGAGVDYRPVRAGEVTGVGGTQPGTDGAQVFACDGGLYLQVSGVGPGVGREQLAPLLAAAVRP